MIDKFAIQCHGASGVVPAGGDLVDFGREISGFLVKTKTNGLQETRFGRNPGYN
jgi:hypothetical protein